MDNTARVSKPYNLAAIRGLVRDAFTGDDLRRFCQDRHKFRPILDHFGPSFSFVQMIDAVIEQCQVHALLPDLAAAIKEANPRQYERHLPHLFEESSSPRLSGALPSTGTRDGGLLPVPTAPAPPAHFVDRQAELTRLVSCLAAGAPTATTALQGMGGTGKTALVKKVAAEAAGFFPGGVLWTTLGPQPDPFHILASWAIAAGGDVRSYTDLFHRAAAVRSLLASRARMLAILDDAWEYDCPFLLMQNALPANTSVLVTTRDADLAKQLRCRVENLDVLGEKDALALIENLIGLLDPYREAAREVADLVGRVPLALELVTALADDPADLPGLVRDLRIKPALGMLRIGSGEQREQSIEACLSMSYAALPARLQACFRYLGAFAPLPFDTAAVAAAWAAVTGEKGAEETKAILRTLVRRGLLSRQEGGFYVQHSLLQAYALALLERECETATARRRHAAHYQALAEEGDWRATEAAFGQIRHGWEAVTKHAPEQLVAYLQALEPFLRWSGRWADLVAWTEYTLEHASLACEPQTRGRLLNDVGYIYWLWGRNAQALDSLRPALDLCRQAGDGWGEGRALNRIGLVYRTEGRLPEAIVHFQESLTIRQEIGDREGIGFCLHNIGLVHRLAGRYLEALDFLQRGLEVFEKDQHVEGKSLCTSNLGRVYRVMGRYREALQFMQEGLALAQEIGDRTEEGETLDTLGDVYRFWGDYPRALELYQQSLEIHQELGSPVGQAYAIADMGEVFFLRGDYDRAHGCYQQSLELWQEVGDSRREASLLDSLGCIHRVRGENEQAMALFERSLSLRREVGDRAGEGRALNQIGTGYLTLGRFGEALDCFRHALEIARETGARPGEGAVLNNIGLALAGQGEFLQALAHLEHSLSFAQDLGEKGEEGMVGHNLGNLYRHMEQPEKARVALERAAAIREEVICAYGDGARRWFE